MFVIFLLFSVAFAFPAENVVQEVVEVQRIEIPGKNGIQEVVEVKKIEIPAENVVREVVEVQKIIPGDNITEEVVKINVTVGELTKGRQDEEDLVDLAGENGGLQLATHIVNLLLGGFMGIGNALAGAGGGGMGTGTMGGKPGGAAGAAGGATATRPKPATKIFY